MIVPNRLFGDSPRLHGDLIQQSYEDLKLQRPTTPWELSRVASLDEWFNFVSWVFIFTYFQNWLLIFIIVYFEIRSDPYSDIGIQPGSGAKIKFSSLIIIHGSDCYLFKEQGSLLDLGA